MTLSSSESNHINIELGRSRLLPESLIRRTPCHERPAVVRAKDTEKKDLIQLTRTNCITEKNRHNAATCLVPLSPVSRHTVPYGLSSTDRGNTTSLDCSAYL